MRLRFLVYAALFLVCPLGLVGQISHAQSSATFDATVKQSLLSLIAELRIKIDRQAAGDQSAFVPGGPINPKLKALGQPIDISFSAPVAAQGLLNLNGRVTHEHGSSQWSLGTLDSGLIVTYAFEVSALDHPPVAVRGLRKPASRAPLPVPPSATPPSSSPTAQSAATPPAPPLVDPRVVEFLFASTRQKVDRPQAENVSYSGERGPLTFGAASVRVPDDHKIGRVELPSSWSLFGMSLSTAPNEHEHFIIKRVVPLSEDAFGQVIREKAAKTALVFVHGFDNTFEDTLYRNAQIVWDLQYKGLSILFTWASRAEMTDYLYDRESAYLAREPFIALLQKLKRDYGIEQVNVLAHSMGNLVALDALANDAQTSNPVHIARLVMAAPDIDRDQFKALASKAKAIVGDMTLYASATDRAMAASRRLAGGVPRAGDVPPDGPIILPNVETIDVTAVGKDLFGLNHDVFAASRDVVADISQMLRFNLPSPRLIQIRAVPEPPAAARYWKYVP